MDQWLVDPNNIVKDPGYAGFKIKMIFTEACDDANCPSTVDTGAANGLGLSA